MRHIKKHIKFISISCFIALISLSCFFTVNLKGAWHYAMNASGSIEVPMSVEVFPWVGAEQLPSDVLGENHEHLIETILNGTYTNEDGTVTQIGLNNPDSYINDEIQSRANGNFWFRSDLLGSMDFWERSDIAKFFDTDTSGLSFLLYFPEVQVDTYYLYTTSIVLGDSNPNIPIGENIYPIYQTELKKNSEGIWEAIETKTGYAESAYYQNPITGSMFLKYPSFNPDTWTEGKLGSSMADAIYTYHGEVVTAYIDDATQNVYYRISISSATTINVSSGNSSAKFSVYDNAGSLVSATAGEQGTANVSFRASANATYYIAVSGATSITFSIN